MNKNNKGVNLKNIIFLICIISIKFFDTGEVTLFTQLADELVVITIITFTLILLIIQQYHEVKKSKTISSINLHIFLHEYFYLLIFEFLFLIIARLNILLILPCILIIILMFIKFHPYFKTYYNISNNNIKSQYSSYLLYSSFVICVVLLLGPWNLIPSILYIIFKIIVNLFIHKFFILNYQYLMQEN